MKLETQYAKGIYDITAAKRQSRNNAEQLILNIREVLAHRGHERLLPRIGIELEKLALQGERRALYQKTTPEIERTRILLQMYRRLVSSGSSLTPHA